MVEYNLAKVGVEGSNPFSRLKKEIKIKIESGGIAEEVSDENFTSPA